MIPRYTNSEMAAVWRDETRYRIITDIEITACEAQEKLGVIPAGVTADIRKKADFDINKINEIEKEVKHDIIALLTNIAEYVGENAKYIHYGMTSSDVLDTCTSIQLNKACDIIINLIDQLIKSLYEKANKFKYTPCIGRTHGIHAEPTTFGIKMLRFQQEFMRNKKRIQEAAKEIAICKISGTVGIYTGIDPAVEKHVAKTFGLTPENIASQIIPRDRHAFLMTSLAILASSIENIATEIRHLQRTEVGEVNEFFAKDQKGSSAMPHKKNPILSENITGLARIIRSYALPALENVTTWHERDISHSSVERIIMPDAFIATDFALRRLNAIISNLEVHEHQMQKNIMLTNGVIFSQKILLKLIDSGISREKAYRIVQHNAMLAIKNNQDFIKIIMNDETIKSSNIQIDITPDDYYQHIDNIYDGIKERKK